MDLMRDQPNEIKDIIAADESLLSPKDAFLLAQSPRACGIFNIKLMKSGGIYPAKQIAAIANKADIDLMWGCNDESAISIAAALHVALSCANTKYLDFDGSLDLVTDIVTGGFQIKDGWMTTCTRCRSWLAVSRRVSCFYSQIKRLSNVEQFH